MVFSTTIQNPHLWNGTVDPHLYNITMEVYYEGVLYHRYQRPYGLRFYEYVIDDTTVLQSGDPYTGFLLNGSPYLLRGVCMHDDITGKAKFDEHPYKWKEFEEYDKSLYKRIVRDCIDFSTRK